MSLLEKSASPLSPRRYATASSRRDMTSPMLIHGQFYFLRTARFIRRALMPPTDRVTFTEFKMPAKLHVMDELLELVINWRTAAKF